MSDSVEKVDLKRKKRRRGRPTGKVQLFRTCIQMDLGTKAMLEELCADGSFGRSRPAVIRVAIRKLYNGEL